MVSGGDERAWTAAKLGTAGQAIENLRAAGGRFHGRATKSRITVLSRRRCARYRIGASSHVSPSSPIERWIL